MYLNTALWTGFLLKTVPVYTTSDSACSNLKK